MLIFTVSFLRLFGSARIYQKSMENFQVSRQLNVSDGNAAIQDVTHVAQCLTPQNYYAKVTSLRLQACAYIFPGSVI